MFHPWGILRKLGHIRLTWADLPVGVLGYTNGVDEIVMDKRLLQVERRCTLTHELVHIEYGHTRCQSMKVERQVCAEASRRLIPIEQMLKHVPWARNLQELAEELWVTRTVLDDRIQCLTKDEWALIDALETQSGW
ncbi:ImmA/IrrE family metallo-endopeptidase [Arthrobacter sp. GMC3]|uniref:ImmA/IrrE family metallo-endopeptidase n=1 Tax=Arthrobacter sp. GMC3 TaxID=2058894 RepID=UPI000CE46FC2|nr:ImmA/IrrE family metallo-endopeptidase [Arthrobacter sp. GMC3]